MNARDTGCLFAATEPDVELVTDHELSTPFAGLVDAYESTVNDRDRLLWKWLDSLVPETTLSCVEPDRRGRALQSKLVATMFVVLLDDLAERRRDRATFEQAMKLPFGHCPVDLDARGVDTEYVTFADHVWTRFEDAVSGAPRFEEFEDVLTFDVRKNVDAIEYSSLANESLDMANLEEATRFEAHNMMLLTYADVDLVHSPGFDRAEFAPLRRIVLDAQEMMRIGNWIATWEREVAEGDFSSGVLVSALENGIVSPAELYEVRGGESDHDPEWLIRRIKEHDVEDRFVERYRALDAEMSRLDEDLSTVDVDAYLGGVEQAVNYYLEMRGQL